MRTFVETIRRVHPEFHGLESCNAMCNDSDRNVDYVVYTLDGNCMVAAFGLEDGSPAENAKILLWTVDVSEACPSEPTGKDAHCVNVTYVPAVEGLVVCLKSSDIVLVNVQDAEAEHVGCFESELYGAAWSNDREVLALVLGQQRADVQVTLMNSEFVPLVATYLTGPDAPEPEVTSVSVGWGKEETQFKGSGARAEERKAGGTNAIAERVRKDTLAKIHTTHRTQDPRAYIAWRGDDEYFAVNAVDEHEAEGKAFERHVRIFNREGQLHSLGVEVLGLEGPITWRPDGRMLAAVQRLPHRYDIIFFERNGLRHNEFSLIHTDAKSKDVKGGGHIVSQAAGSTDVWDVVSITFNESSDALGIHMQNRLQTHSLLQVWKMSNYKWDCQQEYKDVGTWCWVPNISPLRLHYCNRKDGRLTESQLAWDMLCDLGMSQVNMLKPSANVAVLDGRLIRVTPFDRCVIPPPMSRVTVDTKLVLGEGCVNYVTFDVTGRIMAALVGDTHLRVYGTTDQWETYSETLSVDLRECIDDKDVNADGQVAHVRQACLVGAPGWDAPIALAVIWSVASEDFSLSADRYLLVFALFGKQPNLTGKVRLQPGVEVRRMARAADDETSLLLQCNTGIRVIDLNQAPQDIKVVDTYPMNFHSGVVTHFAGRMRPNPIIMTLTNQGKLYCNMRSVRSDVTSFGFHDIGVLATTHAHQLVVLSPRELLLGIGTGSKLDIGRTIENGGKIVCVPGKSTMCILQMPRGNLESIHPRLMVLNRIREAIQAVRYDAAFKLMRRHRIDTNLLYDLNPEQFIAKTETVMKQLLQVQYASASSVYGFDPINLFLTALKPEDVSVTMYGDIITALIEGNSVTPASTVGHQKKGGASSKPIRKEPKSVTAICNAIREALETLGGSKHGMAIVATYARSQPPQLEEALLYIEKWRSAEADADDGEENSSRPSHEAILDFLCFLSDVNVLFDTALGMYNFDLALMVAEKSQKDPGEYLPFLKELNALPEQQKKFRIDRHLGRWTKALKTMKGCEPGFYDELVSVIKSRRLYEDAINILVGDSPDLDKRIYVAYAEALDSMKSSTGGTDEGAKLGAALYFEKAGDFTAAFECYSNALCWRDVDRLARREPELQQRHSETLRQIAVRMGERVQWIEAAQVYFVGIGMEEGLEDGVQCLVNGSHWRSAMSLCEREKRTDLISTEIRPAVEEAFESLDRYLDNSLEKIDMYTDRLEVVRRSKAEKEKREAEALRLMDADEIGGDDAEYFGDDLYSDAGSTVASSQSSRRSRSSKTSKSSTSTRSSKNRRKLERKQRSLKKGSQYEEEALMQEVSNHITECDTQRESVRDLLEIGMRLNMLPEVTQLRTKYQHILQVCDQARTAAFSNHRLPENISILPAKSGADEAFVRTAVVGFVLGPTSSPQGLLATAAQKALKQGATRSSDPDVELTDLEGEKQQPLFLPTFRPNVAWDWIPRILPK
eukprot:Clim_evm73s33 gene=Clim_evmTU73s33